MSGACRSRQEEPTFLLLLFGLSFERKPDIVRIEEILKCEPEAKVLSISLHPSPKQNEESKVLGDLFKYYPKRYQHVETNFREERGLKTLVEVLSMHQLPARGYLDYAWLQTNYYKERPQGYGMNWLPMKIDGKNTWTIGKIKMLMEVGMTEFLLPMDVGGNAKEMIEAYVKACSGPHRKTATKLLLRPLEMTKVRKGCKEHSLVHSDFECARRLGLLQRDPNTQINKFLNKIVPFYIITEWPKHLEKGIAVCAGPGKVRRAPGGKEKSSPPPQPGAAVSRKRKISVPEEEPTETVLAPQWPPRMPLEMEAAILKRMGGSRKKSCSPPSVESRAAKPGKHLAEKNGGKERASNTNSTIPTAKNKKKSSSDAGNNCTFSVNMLKPDSIEMPDYLCPIMSCWQHFSEDRLLEQHLKEAHPDYFKALQAVRSVEKNHDVSSKEAKSARARLKAKKKSEEEKSGLMGSELLDGVRFGTAEDYPIYVCGTPHKGICANPRHRPIHQLNDKGRVVAEFCSGAFLASGTWRQCGSFEIPSHSQISSCIRLQEPCSNGARFKHKHEAGKLAGKPVLQVNEKGSVVAQYNSASEAAVRLGISSSGSIGLVCNKRMESVNGYQFKWKNDCDSAEYKLVGRSFEETKRAVLERVAVHPKPPPAKTVAAPKPVAATVPKPVIAKATTISKRPKVAPSKSSIKEPKKLAVAMPSGKFVANSQERKKRAKFHCLSKRSDNIWCSGKLDCPCKANEDGRSIDLIDEKYSSTASALSELMSSRRDVVERYCCITVASKMCGIDAMDIGNALHGEISKFGQPEGQRLQLGWIQKDFAAPSSSVSSSSSSAIAASIHPTPSTASVVPPGKKARIVVSLNKHNVIVNEFQSAKAAALAVSESEQNIVDYCNGCVPSLLRLPFKFRWKDAVPGLPSSPQTTPTDSSFTPPSSYPCRSEAEYSQISIEEFNTEWLENEKVMTTLTVKFQECVQKKVAMVNRIMHHSYKDEESKIKLFKEVEAQVKSIRKAGSALLKRTQSKISKELGKKVDSTKRDTHEGSTSGTRPPQQVASGSRPPTLPLSQQTFMPAEVSRQPILPKPRPLIVGSSVQPQEEAVNATHCLVQNGVPKADAVFDITGKNSLEARFLAAPAGVQGVGFMGPELGLLRDESGEALTSSSDNRAARQMPIHQSNKEVIFNGTIPQYNSHATSIQQVTGICNRAVQQPGNISFAVSADATDVPTHLKNGAYPSYVSMPILMNTSGVDQYITQPAAINKSAELHQKMTSVQDLQRQWQLNSYGRDQAFHSAVGGSNTAHTQAPCM